MALKIQLRDDYDAVRLRDLARCSSDPRQVRRLLSLAAVYDGLSREAAAAVGGMDRQTLRDWVHRFNKDGPEGLANRKGAGRPRLLTEERMQTLAAIVESGPERLSVRRDLPRGGQGGCAHAARRQYTGHATAP